MYSSTLIHDISNLLVGHKVKRDGSRLLRSLSVATAVALNDQSVESEDDTTEGNSKSEVESEKTGKPQETPVHHVERFLV
jgi:hypothetical protein